MNADEKSPTIVTDEEDCSEDNDRSEDSRRRRLCNERKQPDAPPEGSKAKKQRTEAHHQSAILYNRNMAKRPRPYIGPRPVGSRVMEAKKSQWKIYSKTRDTYASVSGSANAPQESVIFINPRFIKKFVEKSMKLGSMTTTANLSSHAGTEQTKSPAAATSSSTVIKDIDFDSCPQESLQAAATMTIVRLVAECIQDDYRRDERLNKVLIGRLMDKLTTRANANLTSQHETDQKVFARPS